MKVAVIGSGISGLASAWLLQGKYEVTLFEKNDYFGGHSNTASIEYDGKKIDVDTGFIVFNFKTYPNLKAFFELLNVEIDKSDMSFGIRDFDSGLEYSGNNLFSLFAQKRNLVNPKFFRMLKDIMRFNKSAISLIENGGDVEGKTLADFIDELKLGDYFKNYYLFPMAGAIWSCPIELIKHYPAKTFLQFFYNHGLLTVINQPQWYTVRGGSKQYVQKIISALDNVKCGCNIVSSHQVGKKIVLRDNEGQDYEFDHVVFASHANQTCNIISDKTDDEKAILAQINYSNNLAVLHKDKKQMPKNKKAWASWVYLSKQQENKVSLSYWMNNLQNIDANKELFVTLNPIEDIAKEDVFASYHYAHPIFDEAAIRAQDNLETIQGKRNMWFCGAWTKYGFHEDGLNSAISVAKKLGVIAPWIK
ncbi:MAG: FAD-dependent oxidoreductase [Rickettsiales bacterium]|nr:FAD-dependent oxidoreductase [Rickettsiales bacterium]